VLLTVHTIFIDKIVYLIQEHRLMKAWIQLTLKILRRELLNSFIYLAHALPLDPSQIFLKDAQVLPKRLSKEYFRHESW
jgi:hypothetical protein